MARCKMDQPERAAYLRVFCAHLLTDEDFETLTRAQFGSACLLMFNAWAKKGSLPADTRKLAALAKCTIEELNELLAIWPKLVPLEDLEPETEPGARVTIPYLWREWCQVMGFYQAQTQRSALGVAARKAMGNPVIDPSVTHGSPKGIPNQDQDQDQDQDQEKDSCAKPAKADPAPDPSPVIYQVHCVGKKPLWPMTQGKMDEWAETFPGVDLKLELRKAIQWLKDNPQRGKTFKGMPAYFNTWLTRAQNAAPARVDGVKSKGTPTSASKDHAPLQRSEDPAVRARTDEIVAHILQCQEVDA